MEFQNKSTSMNEPIFLLIETATDVCSVAISQGEKILSVVEDKSGNSHAKNLLPFIDKALNISDLTLKDVNAVIVDAGPGSYTGLRIGVSTAKGIAYTNNLPVIAVNSLRSIAQNGKDIWQQNASSKPLLIPMLDARRMEVYTCVYDFDFNEKEDISAKIIDENAYLEFLDNNEIIFCGNGMPKGRAILEKHFNARFVETGTSAKHLLPAALKKWESESFENTAYFEPFYLKDYVAGKPVVKGLK